MFTFRLAPSIPSSDFLSRCIRYWSRILSNPVVIGLLNLYSCKLADLCLGINSACVPVVLGLSWTLVWFCLFKRIFGGKSLAVWSSVNPEIYNLYSAGVAARPVNKAPDSFFLLTASGSSSLHICCSWYRGSCLYTNQFLCLQSRASAVSEKLPS